MRTKLEMRWHPSFAFRYCFVFFRFFLLRIITYIGTGSKYKRENETNSLAQRTDKKRIRLFIGDDRNELASNRTFSEDQSKRAP